MRTTTPILAWGRYGLTPIILSIKSKSTKSTGVFIGLSKSFASYLLYDHVTNKTHRGSNMRSDEDNFPILDLLLVGEMHPSDKHLDVVGWRSPATLNVYEAEDEELAAFCTGKQVEVAMPATWRPHLAPGHETVRVHALVRQRYQDKILAVEVECKTCTARDPLHSGLPG